jgi:SprT protein
LNQNQILYKHLPADAVEVIGKFISDYQINLRITSSRKTKLGDFRPPSRKSIINNISINGDLHPEFFLLVFIHELAHLLVWKNFKKSANPHGKEWKLFYGELIRDFIEKRCFNEELTKLLYKFSYKPKATFAGDHALWKYLRKINSPEKDNVYISELPIGALFLIPSGRIFRKESKVRTRFKCLCVKTKRWFLFHPLADITPVKEKENAA